MALLIAFVNPLLGAWDMHKKRFLFTIFKSMAALKDSSYLVIHTVGANYRLIDGLVNSGFYVLSNYNLIAFLTAGELCEVLFL